MPLIRQTVRGQFRSNDILINEADQAILLGLFEGMITVYDEKAMGGN